MYHEVQRKLQDLPRASVQAIQVRSEDRFALYIAGEKRTAAGARRFSIWLTRLVRWPMDPANQLGAQPGCVMLLGERPSFDASYGHAVSGVYELVKTLAVKFNRAVDDFHVTDLIKFRGEPGHSTEGNL